MKNKKLRFAIFSMQEMMDNDKLREGWQRISPAFFCRDNSVQPDPALRQTQGDKNS
ncbi:MAG: hypothetical protein V4561_09935 [Bacteroidota bacterium]